MMCARTDPGFFKCQLKDTRTVRMVIRWKLALGIGLPLLLIYAGSLALVTLKLQQRGYARVNRQLTELAGHYAGRLDGQFRTFAQIGQTTAAFLTVHQDLTEAELMNLLETNVNQDPLIYGSCVSYEPFEHSADRRLFCPYVYRGEGGLQRMDVADAYDYTDPKWEWYRIPRETGQAFWTEPFFDEGAGNIIMCTFVAPFFRDGKFRGTVNIDIPLDELQVRAGAEAERGETFTIISRNGHYIVHSNPAYIMHESIFSVAEREGRDDLAGLGKRMIAAESGAIRMDAPSADPLLVFFAPIRSTGWSLSAALSESTVLEFEHDQLMLSVTGMLVALGVITLVVLYVASRITKPIERLAGAVSELSKGNLESARVEVHSRDEIGDLARAFNKMVADLRQHVAALTEMTRTNEAVNSELRVAHNIQSALLPRTFPPFPHLREFDLHAVNAPARHIGGDFFDFFFVDEDVLMIVIADVAGKGVPAAMFMAVARTIIRNLAPTCPSPGLLLSRINTLLLQDNTESMFVTIVVCRYNVRTGRMVYANAGHPRPYLLNGHDSPRPFGEVTGTIVGIIPDLTFTEASAELSPGDRLVFYTDGVTEARSPHGQFFQDHGLRELLGRVNGESVEEICAACIRRVSEFQAGDISDDITVLVLKRNHPAPLPDQSS